MFRRLFITVLAMQCLEPAVSAEFSDKWSLIPPSNAVGKDICGASIGHRHPFDVCQSTLNSCLEYKTLTPKASLVFKVKVPESGPPSYLLVANTGTADDFFYAVQAFHNCGVFSTYASSNNAEGIWTVGGHNYQNNHNCPELFFTQHPDLKNKVCVTHVIPTCASDLYPSIFSDEALHSELNLVAIPKSNIEAPAFEAIRKDWFNFFETHKQATRESILTHASFIQKKYRFIFQEIKKKTGSSKAKSRLKF